jgi:hypothetical protein
MGNKRPRPARLAEKLLALRRETKPQSTKTRAPTRSSDVSPRFRIRVRQARSESNGALTLREIS